MRKKTVILSGAALLLIILCIVIWNILFSTTHIAFVNYQVITLGQIAKSNDNERIKLSVLDVEDIEKTGKYDAVLINGMGLRITADQRAILQNAAEKGVCIITTMATNPANDINSADSTTVATVKGYLMGKGRINYRNMLTYIRRNIDGKTLDTEKPDQPIMRKQKQFYHIDPTTPEDEAVDFSSVAEYNSFLKKHNLLNEDAPRIIVTGQMGEPEDLIAKLEESGNVVYPVRNMQALLKSRQIDSICPSAVINMAHGRLGDAMVNYLLSHNIPMFAPLNINQLVEVWENDKMGMNGGFLSQSIVMPEIDGAIRPYALFGNRLGEDGLQQAYTIPERLETFVQTVNNHIALQSKPNSEKRVAIYYYKGPGQNAMTAAGMAVAPSLYNLLSRMKDEGYRIENLPASADELNKLIQRQGAVFNAYAGGAKADFLKNGNPQLISAKEYNEWTAKSVRPTMMADVVALDGEFPGSYISTDKGELALPRVELGNVVLLPQLAAGAGDDDFAIVHGTNAAPPHAYIASYLWAQYDFGADVMIHFGTHGSLEFTPKKQVALSNNDWADVLVGSMPHLYVYSIADVGEGVIAKRRSYATLQSHLTPPFMESNVRGIYKELSTAIQEYNDLLYADGNPDTDDAALKVKRLTVELGIHRDLRLDSVLNVPYTQQEIARIENFAEELTNERITGELYTLGQPYSEERINSSVHAMTLSDSLELAKLNETKYKTALKNSPEAELASIINAMNGGYTAPSPGGDPIANPNTIPTGRNLYAINAEATPSETAWKQGIKLAESTINMYRERHNDSIPRKVSYTLWSSEFVETEGATIAQVLYMLGVEPVRDVFGRVTDLRLIPSEQLGRPRIDVVVQTSGQLRDIAASRLFLISRAVKMAAAAKDDIYENFVAQSTVEAERALIERGLSPQNAREVSTYRVFGGVNGSYGTGITAMVQSGDRWENSTEIADVYIKNMGAFYGSEKDWEKVQQFALEAALTNTDAVIQPRQSNTWGALSLDHVYEFMGGMNLAVRNITGKEPDAYMSDYRNRHNMRMQELKEAIGVESRTSIFNPAYIKEKMKGEASAAAVFAEIIQNTYGWNVMKPDVVDNELWDEIYNVYVQDKFELGVRDFFERENPAALQEMTAVMMETARKEMWKASAEQLAEIAKLHTELIEEYKPSCSGMVCDNSKLREFIASKTTAEMALQYQQSIKDIRESSLSNDKSMVLKREELNNTNDVRTIISNTLVAVLVVAAIVLLTAVVRRRRKKMEE
ncbi:MAG: cobaltochelatase subunit CobN [Paludibacteraceae bacterium]|nr:cobaltochelatase subunit CobN [Paludibacteraceae bacterium]